MKQKQDFITNSSSCSFVAWGISMNAEALKETCGKRLFELKQRKDDLEKAKKATESGAFMVIKSDLKEDPKELEEFLEDVDFVWEIESLIPGLDVQTMPYEDEIMIGESPFAQKPNQTLTEFKQDISDKLTDLGIETKPDELLQIEECWMDG